MIDSQSVAVSVDGVPLEYVEGAGGSLTFDRRWTPYMQGEVTVVEPDDLSILDPRGVPRLVLELMQRFGAGLQFVADLTEMFAGPGAVVAEVSAAWTGLTLADLSNLPGRWYETPREPTSLRAELVIRRCIRNGDGTARLVVEGVEARFRDYYIPYVGLFPPGTLRELYDGIRGRDIGNRPGTGTPEFALTPGRDFDVSTAVDIDTGFIRAAGDDVYKRMEALLTLVDARLWGDENGQLQLTATEDADTTPLELTAARITEARETIDMDADQWADSVQIVYAEGTASENGYDGFYYQLRAGDPVKTVKVELAGASPVYGWNFDTVTHEIAGPILERRMRRGRTLPITAVSDFTARPDRQVVLTDVPGTPDLTGIASAVRFDIDAAEMTITTEYLEESTP